MIEKLIYIIDKYTRYIQIYDLISWDWAYSLVPLGICVQLIITIICHSMFFTCIWHLLYFSGYFWIIWVATISPTCFMPVLLFGTWFLWWVEHWAMKLVNHVPWTFIHDSLLVQEGRGLCFRYSVLSAVCVVFFARW